MWPFKYFFNVHRVERPSTNFFRRFVVFFFITIIMLSMIEWSSAKSINFSMQPSKNLLFYKIDDKASSPSDTADQDNIVFQDVLGIDKKKTIQLSIDGILPLFHKHFLAQTNTSQDQILQQLSLMDEENLLKMILDLIHKDAAGDRIFGLAGQSNKRGYPIQLVDPSAPTTNQDDQHDLFIPLEHLNIDDIKITPESSLQIKNILMEQLIQDMREYSLFYNPVEVSIDQILAAGPHGKAITHLKSQFEEVPQCLPQPTILPSATDPALGKTLDHLMKDLGHIIGKFSDYRKMWNDADMDYEKLISTADQELSTPLKSLKKILINARAKKILCLHLLEKNYIQKKTALGTELSELESLKKDLFPGLSTDLSQQNCLFNDDFSQWESEKNHLSAKDKNWLKGITDPDPADNSSTPAKKEAPTPTHSRISSKTGPHLTEVEKNPSSKSERELSQENEKSLDDKKEALNKTVAPPLAYPAPVFFPNFAQPQPYMDPLYFSPLYGLWSPFYLSGSYMF